MEFVSLPTPTARPIRLVQITDCHLGRDEGERLLGMNTDESLRDVLDLVASEQPFMDLLTTTGDIASAGAGYQRFLNIINEYFPSVPLAWLPGNHDAPSAMDSITETVSSVSVKPYSRSIVLGSWQIVMLDSSVPGHVHGDLSESELAFLQTALNRHPEKHTFILLHHQPVLVGSEWIDQYLVRNADDLFALVDRHPQVKAVVWGHVHQNFASTHNAVQLLSTPSTCIQFKPDMGDFTVDHAMPGYRWFDLYENGEFETVVSRTGHKDYDIDYLSNGY